jgi:TolB protein
VDEDIRRALVRMAEEVAPVSHVPPTLHRRARLRLAILGAGALFFVSALAMGAVTVLGSTPNEGNDQLATSPTPGESEPVTPQGRIMFIANGDAGRNQLWELYEIDADGSNYGRLTRDRLMLEGVSSLSWSRDGRRAVFAAGTGEGTGDLRVVEAQSGEVSTIYEGTGDEVLFGPDWSPNSQRLVAYDAAGDLVILNADGSGLKRLTDSGDAGGHLSPAWSPDGSEIAFACDCSGDSGVYVVDVAGGNQKKVAHGESNNPRWSPDGSRIAYNTQRGQIHVVDVTTGTDVQLTEEAENFDPAWSPDGQFIAFMSDRDGNLNLYVMTSQGQEERALTSTPVDESAPAWPPEG